MQQEGKSLRRQKRRTWHLLSTLQLANSQESAIQVGELQLHGLYLSASP